MKKEIILISFSGGRTSAMMTRWLLLKYSDKYQFVVVFANTGHEREATLRFVNECDKCWNFKTVWIESVTNPEYGIGARAKIVNYDTAYRNIRKNGIDPFEEMIAKYGIPNSNFKHCSRELKARTIRAYVRTLGLNKSEYKTAIGIRSDEPKRLDFKNAKKENLIYPLATWTKTTIYDVNKFWLEQGFDLELKSFEGNCILCWKKSFRKLWTLISSNNPEIIAEIEWLKHIEIKYGDYVPPKRESKPTGPLKMFREGDGIDDLIESAKLGFTPAIDESNVLDNQAHLWNDSIDMNFGCVESCEPF